MDTITQEDRVQTLLGAYNAHLFQDPIYEDAEQRARAYYKPQTGWEVDGRSKQGKTYKALRGYEDTQVEPIRQGISSQYDVDFLVTWGETKDQWADKLKSYDETSGTAMRDVEAIVVSYTWNVRAFCLRTEDGFRWTNTWSANDEQIGRVGDLFRNDFDLVAMAIKKIDQKEEEQRRHDHHVLRLQEMRETQPLTVETNWTVEKCQGFVSEYEAEIGTLNPATMRLEDIYTFGVNKVVAKLCRTVIEEVGKNWRGSSCQRVMRSNKDAYTIVQADDVIFWLMSTWRYQQWNEYKPFMEDAMQKFNTLVGY